MARRKVVATLLLLVFSLFVVAKDKKPVPLPVDILKARTVLVIVDPSAGVDARDPTANRAARVDVEQALDKWGRFAVVQEGYTADLIIMVRKSNGKIVQPTIGRTSVNGVPPVNVGSTSTPDQTTTRAGVRWGSSGTNDPSAAGSQPGNPQPQIEAGPTQDTFVVYRGNKDDPNWSPLDAPAVWRYSAKNALEAPSVPAVEAFRKVIAESEKQLASNP
jgi:hypothetical protein